MVSREFTFWQRAQPCNFFLFILKTFRPGRSLALLVPPGIKTFGLVAVASRARSRVHDGDAQGGEAASGTNRM
jgi:hypothetical protein